MLKFGFLLAKTANWTSARPRLHGVVLKCLRLVPGLPILLGRSYSLYAGSVADEGGEIELGYEAKRWLEVVRGSSIV